MQLKSYLNMALTKKQKEKIRNEYKQGKYTPQEIWKIRETGYYSRSSEDRFLVKIDDKEIMNLRKDRTHDQKMRFFRGMKLKKNNPSDPYGDIPDCEPLRDGGDPREDVYCLLPEERALLKGDYYGMTLEKYPQLEFLRPYTEDNMHPNHSSIYYNTLVEGVPTVTSNKYVARFYGEFDREPFTQLSFHKHKGTDKERTAVPVSQVKEWMVNNRIKTEENRMRIYALEDKAKEHKKDELDRVKSSIYYRKKRLKDMKEGKIKLKNAMVIKYQEELKDFREEKKELEKERNEIQKKADSTKFFERIDTLDKPYTKVDGTETFRDAVAIHDAPHSVALFLNEIEKEKIRPKEEQNRQFAIFNIVRLAFPYGIEYVKYYTQGGGNEKAPKKFPLVVTSPLTTAEEDLQANGLPKAGTARWCTRMYKEEPSEHLYKDNDLFGITQLLGMTRFQSGSQTSGRKSRQPATKLSKLALESENVIIEGDPDDPPIVPIRAIPMPKIEPMDEFGDSAFYDVKYYVNTKDEKGWKAKKFIPQKFKIYQTQPIFDWTDEEQLEKMKEYGVDISPIIEDLDFHGCLLCPMRNAEYYRSLYNERRFLWSIADDLRRAGSYRKIVKGEGEYYYTYNPADGTMEEMAEKYPERFIHDDGGNLRPVM